MGKLMMENFYKGIAKLLPKDLKESIVCAMIKSPHKPVIESLTGYGVMTELSLNAEEKLASELFRFNLKHEVKQRRQAK